MARVLPHPARATHARPRRLAGLGAAVVFSLTLVSGVVAPGMAGAVPAGTGAATGQVPNGSNGVNHNDPAPTIPACLSGPCTTPQPYSTADHTNNGANTTSSTNPYVSTRHGLPSDNGSGTGLATGRPCAGCVGKADNKNPQGQAPNGPSDHNNGYECDGNNGIGQTNPAHTGCTGTTTTGGGAGGGGGGSCTPTTANNCGTGGSGGGSCTPTANNNCGTGGGGGGSCTPTANNNNCGTGGSGGGSCTPTTAPCTPPACSAPGPAPAPCSAASVLALQGSRLPTASAPTPSSPPTAVLAADGTPTSPATSAAPAAVATRVLGESGARSLPFTGVDLDTLLLAAVGLGMAGATAQALGRRTRARG